MSFIIGLASVIIKWTCSLGVWPDSCGFLSCMYMLGAGEGKPMGTASVIC